MNMNWKKTIASTMIVGMIATAGATGALAQTPTASVAAKSAPAATSKPVTTTLTTIQYTTAQQKLMKKEFAKFKGFEAAYAPKQMIRGDAFKNAVAGDDSVTLLFKEMIVRVSPRDSFSGTAGSSVTLSNHVKAKWFTSIGVPTLGFKLDSRYVTLSSPDKQLSKAQLEKVAVTIAKLTK